MSDRLEVKYLPLDVMLSDEDNPNYQQDAVFNNLVENIQEIGMVEPIMVAPAYDEENNELEGQYRIVSGHHRYEACKLLDYEEIPCIVQENFDEDMQKFQLVRMNVLKGKLDPVKFTKLYNKMADKYGDELIKTAMGLVDEQAFNNLYINVKKELPKELQDKLGEAKDDIKNVDDLSRILNEMFSKYGDTLKHNYMVFQYGGKTHLWVMMDKELKENLIDNTLDTINEGDYDIAQFFTKLLLKHGQSVLDELEPMGTKEENVFEAYDNAEEEEEDEPISY